MTLRLSDSRQLRRSLTTLAMCTIAAAAACGPKAAPPTPAPTPTAAAPAVMQTCPDPTDGPSIVSNAVQEAHRAWVANSATPLPPACVLTAFAHISSPMPDSLNAAAVALSGELRRRGGANQRELLAAEIVLDARLKRYGDVSTAYTRLVALDSQPAIELSRLAIAAARQRADTATLVRLLARTATRPGAGSLMASELNVLRQVGALHSAINESRGLVRQNPKYAAAYPSLVGNFGTLGASDSVAAYIHRAVAQGVPRATLSPSVENFVVTTLRHAALYGSTYGWDAEIAASTRVDSALSTPSTKFLVATLLVQSTEAPIAQISSELSGSAASDPAARAKSEQHRNAACQRIAPVSRRFDAAQTYLRNGGDRFNGPGVQQLSAGLAAGQSTLATLQTQCARP
jgi:hypothetical protein